MSKTRTFVGVFLSTVVGLCLIGNKKVATPPSRSPAPAITMPAPMPEPAAPQKRRVMAVRVLIVKHSRESMADMDARLATESAEKAAGMGLDIRVVGNVWHTTSARNGLKEVISEHMKKAAKDGDTFLVHTIGHGGPTGVLQNLGQRADVVKAIAEAAKENRQRTLWWQLSCYASANLPRLDTLDPDQQNLLSILSSSNSREQSEARTQARIMGLVFAALAGHDGKIDPDGDNSVSGRELRNFLNGIDGMQRGSLLLTRDEDDPIFGGAVRKTMTFAEAQWFGP